MGNVLGCCGSRREEPIKRTVVGQNGRTPAEKSRGTHHGKKTGGTHHGKGGRGTRKVGPMEGPFEGGAAARRVEATALESFRGFYCVVMTDGTILKANDRVRNIVSIKEGISLSGYSIKKYIHTDCHETVDAAFALIAAGEAPASSMEIPYIVAGSVITLTTQIEAHGKGVALKIDETAMQSLKTHELQKTKSLIRKSKNMTMWLVDGTGIIRDVVDETMRRHLSYSASEMIGTNMISYVAPEQRKFAANPVGADGRRIEAYTLYRLHKDGHRVKAQVTEGLMCSETGEEFTMYIDDYSG